MIETNKVEYRLDRATLKWWQLDLSGEGEFLFVRKEEKIVLLLRKEKRLTRFDVVCLVIVFH